MFNTTDYLLLLPRKVNIFLDYLLTRTLLAQGQRITMLTKNSLCGNSCIAVT